jgi:hypothetical protein
MHRTGFHSSTPGSSCRVKSFSTESCKHSSTRASYYTVMAAVALDAYSAPETTRLLAEHAHPGPWNAKWVPTPIQLEAYAAVVHAAQDAWPVAPPSLKVGRNR